ncbi:MAG: formylglycine-generating enzyme family protein [Candidatus Magnetominusculus sp. LBB02]|nr:formylglycine-generating enzyme family protein [Candidatus Magnetominusculus sp. LBB02]
MKKSVIVCMLFMMVTLSQSVYGQGVSDIPMVFVKGGCYQMGETSGDVHQNEKPAHEVCVRDFYMGKYQVTQSLWKEVMGDNPSKLQTGESYPVESVSWNDVQRFIQRLNAMTGKKYNLPTEAQWEFACREGGKDVGKAYTVSEKELSDYAWYRDNAEGSTHAVGQKHPNELGLYDMLGNVWVWLRDAYAPDAYADGKTTENIASDGRRVIRGGNFNTNADSLRCSRKGSYPSGSQEQDIGFRLVLED